MTGPGASTGVTVGPTAAAASAAEPLYADALAGLDGTADPAIRTVLPTVYADPTAEGQGAGPGNDQPDFGVVRIPVPHLAVTIDPEMLAKAEADLARQVEKDRVEFEHAQLARRDAAVRSTAARRAPVNPAQQSVANYLPPGTPDAIRRAMAQVSIPTGGRQASPPARQRQQVNTTRSTKKSGGGALGVLIFIIVILFATGLGQKLIQLIQDLVNR